MNTVIEWILATTLGRTLALAVITTLGLFVVGMCAFLFVSFFAAPDLEESDDDYPLGAGATTEGTPSTPSTIATE